MVDADVMALPCGQLDPENATAVDGHRVSASLGGEGWAGRERSRSSEGDAAVLVGPIYIAVAAGKADKALRQCSSTLLPQGSGACTAPHHGACTMAAMQYFKLPLALIARASETV